MDLSSWLNTLNWGSVADWFTGLLTAGTLFVAVMILYTDRRSKRRAAADAFSTWQQFLSSHAVKEMANYTVKVHSFNAGDRPIPFAMIIPSPTGEEQWPGTAITIREGAIPPGVEGVHEIGLDQHYSKTPLLMIFTDGNGQRWIRGLSSNRYLSKRVIRRTWRKWGRVHPMNTLWDYSINPKKLARVRQAHTKEVNEKWAAELAARTARASTKIRKK